MLMGRDAALSRGATLAERATRGQGTLLLVSGEAGIGKSSLSTALLERALSLGCTPIRGRAWEYAEAPPYFPVWSCLSRLGLSSLAKDPQTSDFLLWESVLSALARDSREQPIVWLLEDLHAADLQTLDLLTFLLPALPSLSLLVIVTARDLDPRMSERAKQRLQRMAREGEELRLTPFDTQTIAQTAQQLGLNLSAADLTDLHHRTGGNPLFVVESLNARRAGFRPSAVLPHSLRELALERVQALPDGTRRSLRCGAVLGREFSAAVAARLIDATAARVIDSLAPALRAGILNELRPGHFAFSHILVRDAIEQAMTSEERAGLHSKAERALSRLGEGLDVLLERTHHALLALSCGDGERAQELSRRVLAALESQGAFDRALSIHQRVREAQAEGLWPTELDAASTLHVARVAEAAGALQTSRALCREVIAATSANAESVLFARAVLVYGSVLQPGFVDRELVAWLHQALARIDAATPTLRCLLQARLAAALQPAPDPQVPVTMAREAIAAARATRDAGVLMEVLTLAGSALADYAPLEERISVSSELLSLAEPVQDLPRALRALSRLALDHLEQGAFQAFERDVDQLLELSARAGHPRHRWRPLLCASMRAALHGRFAESAALVREVEALRELTDDPALSIALSAHTTMTARTQHQSERMQQVFLALGTQMESAAHGSTVIAIVRLSILARLPDGEDEARRELARITPMLDQLLLDSGFCGWLAEALALWGEDEMRRRALRALSRVPGAHHTGGHVAMTYEGPVARSVALLEASLGDRSSAEARLRAALDVAKRHRHGPFAARLALDLAKLASTEAEAHLLCSEARQSALELDMPGIAREVELVLARLAPRSKDPKPDAVAPSPTNEVRCERDGEDFVLIVMNRKLRLRDSRGMQWLAHLIERRGEDIHVLALVNDAAATVSDGSLGTKIDGKTLRECRARFLELAEDLLEAEQAADLARIERLAAERNVLETYLLSAVGLGGKLREEGSVSERARVNVQRRLRDAVAKIRSLDPDVGRFIEQNLRTGTFCRFGALEL